ncbi:MAG: M48 family metallopeptidase, partial [Cyanobacteria bacterium P01_A01_bin.17]
FGSLKKTLELRQGGQVVAESLGGVLVLPSTTNPSEQKLLHVVEEMAIASGISVPSVYLLHRERGINAFAAGNTVNDAVIGVTWGCIEELSRDELQGVIAHEFSHILNGDMRLNIRLMGILHGILIIYLSGRVLLRAESYSSHSKNAGGMLGFALMAVGSIGLLMGRLIKSAVSRQREFLADASAVQFTRDPQGIGNALLKISDSTSRLRSPQAEAASHMFFSNSVGRVSLSEMLATHPPLDVRIQRLGIAVETPPRRRSAPSSTQAAVASEAVMGFQQGQAAIKVAPEQVVEQVGTAAPEHLAYIQTLLEKLPQNLKKAVKYQHLSAAIVYALLLDKDHAMREQQLNILRQNEPADVVKAVVEYGDAIATLDPRTHLPLIELTIPALRRSTNSEWTKFCQQVQQLTQADGHLSLSESVLQIILERRLQPHFGAAPDSSVLYTTLDQIWADSVTVLSHLASAGHDIPDTCTYALRCGLFRLPGANQHTIPDQLKPNNFRQFIESLKRLARTTPQLKKALVDACSYTVMLDGTVTVEEAELLRGTVIALGCPIPPFLNAAIR